MPVIELSTVRQALGLPEGEPIDAKVTAWAWVGEAPHAYLDGDTLVVPGELVVRLVAGVPTEPFDLAPDNGAFCWRIEVETWDPGHSLVRYVTVPDVEGPIDFGDLVDVDPASFDPAAEPEAVWRTDLDALSATVADLTDTVAEAADDVAEVEARVAVVEDAPNPAPLLRRPRVGFIGDSITKGTDTVPADHGYQDSPGVYAMLASDGRWTLVTNTGAAANTSAAILARLQTDIIDKGVTTCVIASCSWNDIAAGFTVEQTVANFEAIVDTLLAANIQPVIAEVTPDGRTGSTPERLLAMELRNRAYLDIAGSRGVPVVAFFNDLVDVATGTLSVVNNADGSVHPNAAGYKRMGDKIAPVLAAILPPRASGHITYATDPTDLLGGAGLFRTDTTPANGVGDGWQDFGGAGSTPSLIGGAPKGNYQRWTLSGAEERFVFRDIPAAVGDVIELSGFITQSSSARGRVRLEAIGAPTPYEESYVHLMVGTTLAASSPFAIRLTMPEGTTGGRVSLCPMSGTGNLDFAQVAARNLTALGLA